MKNISPTPLWRKIIKIVLWSVMAVVLTFVAVAMCLVNLVSEESLTALTSRVVNKLLDAEVGISRVDLSFSGDFPLLKLEVDSVTVISGPMLRLKEEERTTVPAWGDTLLTLSHFRGGIDLGALMRGKLHVYDVEFVEPEINIVSVNDSISNYVIYNYHPSPEDADTAGVSMPEIIINRFSITNPRPLRFHNAATGEHFDLKLRTFAIDGGQSPTYALDMGGDMAMPSLSLYNLDNIRFGVNGNISWNPEKPTELELEDFTLLANFINTNLSAHIDFARDIIVRDYGVALSQTKIEDIVSVLPDSLRRVYGIDPGRFSTDCRIDFALRSTAPFNLTTDSVPSADFEINVSPGKLKYDRTVFKEVSGKLRGHLRGNNLNTADFEAIDVKVSGPATALVFNVKATEVMNDPYLTGSVEGKTNLAYLPAQLRRLMNGYVKGRINANVKFEGRPSMIAPNHFHKLNLSGTLSLNDFYYLSSDTASMFDVRHASFDFGTQTKLKFSRNTGKMLTAMVKIDSADILQNQYSMKISDFSLGVGASNVAPVADSTVVIPMGGDLKVGKFYLTVLGDSVAFYMRGGRGRVTMKRYHDEARRPLFGLNLNVEHISTGSPLVRFMVSDADITASAFKTGRRQVPENIKNMADSIKKVSPDLPVDSVYARAIRIVNEKRKHHSPRVHKEYVDSAEIIYWGTSKGMRELLLDWNLKGSIKAHRAGLYTPFFPIRNRVRDFNVSFCNDSIVLTNVRYKAGVSDFLLSGKISNIRRGFTSKGFRSPLKLDFKILSDTIDVNELANGTFRGSAYAAAYTTEESDVFHNSIKDDNDSEDEFEKELDCIVKDSSDSIAPLLVPKNIDASLDMRANNILYSDLLFHDFKGELLASRGALNLHNLTASSDMGSINLSALYSSRNVNDLRFGFGMEVNRFNIERFVKLMPALDSIMPLLRDFGGIIDADVAATCDIDKGMNLVLPTLEAAIRISGDSLVMIDSDTYKTIGKWLMFKDKQSNVINHMNVELTIKNDVMQLYPFIFDLDRYKLGVQGYNDLDLNFDYHIAVLKSPLPFKFGINIKGNPDKYKIRLGKARLNEHQVAQSVAIVDTTRVNLLAQLENVFRRGVDNSRFGGLNISSRPTAATIDLNADTISHADSLIFIKEGLIPAPIVPQAVDTKSSKKGKRKQSHGK